MKEIITEWVGDKKSYDSYSTSWWKIKESDQHKSLFATVKLLEQNQSYQAGMNLRHARLYSNISLLGSHSLTGATDNRMTPLLQNRLSVNVVKACCDTALNKISKNRPRPMFLTEGGNWQLQQKAKKLTKFLDGLFDQMKIYDEMQRAFLDSLVFGTGAVKVYADEMKETICAERTIIDELIVDDLESETGRPKSLYQRRLVAKEVLLELYPEKSSLIEQATNGIMTGAFYSEAAKNLVKVVEAWHLPSVKGAKDGLHVISIDSTVLYSEPWQKEFFPFVFLKWTNKLNGFWGLGIAENLTGLQVEINKILRSIQENMALISNNRIYVENNSEVSLQSLNNIVGGIVKYTGQPPIVSVTPAMTADVYNHLWNLYNKAFEQEGISQLSAGGVKPEGLDSAVALREFNDIESDRFMLAGQRYEQAFLDLAKISIDLMKDLSEKIDVKVKVEDSGAMQFLNFKEVSLEEDQYILRCFPASLLPTRPSAKMQTIVEYTQAGFLDKETAMDLMDFPDLQAATDRIIAPRKIIYKMLDEMMASGEYMPPEPFFNLALAKSYSQQYYMSAKLDNAPEDRLELIRQFMSDIDALTQIAVQAEQEQMMAAQQAAQAQQMAAQGQPPEQFQQRQPNPQLEALNPENLI